MRAGISSVPISRRKSGMPDNPILSQILRLGAICTTDCWSRSRAHRHRAPQATPCRLTKPELERRKETGVDYEPTGASFADLRALTTGSGSLGAAISLAC